jgi:hypothetical protein
VSVLPYTRVLAALLIPFLAVAFVLLYVLPGTTEELFAWTIAPSLSAMMLGSAYLGGIVFFLHVARGGAWSRVGRGFPAVLTFATLALIATILHWDKFHFGHISFITWVILYLATPALVLAAIILQRGTDTATGGYLVPRPQRVVLAVVGIAATLTGVVLFIQPPLLVDTWAWQLTPLTARIVGAVLTLPGMVNVWMLIDPRWSAFRAIFQAQLVSLGAILLALVLARADLDWSRPLTPFIVGGLVASGICYAAFYIESERRARS